MEVDMCSYVVYDYFDASMFLSEQDWKFEIMVSVDKNRTLEIQVWFPVHMYTLRRSENQKSCQSFLQRSDKSAVAYQ